MPSENPFWFNGLRGKEESAGPCSQCVFSKPELYGSPHLTCTKPYVVDRAFPLTAYCDLERWRVGACKPTGRFFRPKPVAGRNPAIPGHDAQPQREREVENEHS